MILPLSHDRMTVQRLPWVTIGILVLNFVVFFATWPRAVADYARLDELGVVLQDYAMSHPGVLEEGCETCPDKVEFQEMLSEWDALQAEHIFSRYGYVPARPRVAGLFGSLFLHAGWMHLLGNMYFLWLCGCSIEDLWGRPLYAVVYLLGGAGAALTHAALQPESTAHLVGASGAIAALMGIFCLRCWNTRIRFFYWLFVALVGTFTAPAWIMLALWFLRELGSAFVYADSSSVAFGAHIGGFCFGVAVAMGMKLTRLEEKLIAPAIDRKTNLVAKHPKLASAVEHFDRGDYPKAVSDLRIAVQEDRDDPDLFHLLARCYQELGRPQDAARWLRQELAIQLRRREIDVAVQTYEELLETLPEVELAPRELLPLATALTSVGHEGRAKVMFEKLMATAPEPTLRLRATLALADLHHQAGRTRQALTLLDQAETIVEGQLEWKEVIDGKREEFHSSMSLPAALSDL